MNAFNNDKKGWIKAILGVVLAVGLVSANLGCDESDVIGGFQNIPGTRNTHTNPAGDDIWGDLQYFSQPSLTPTTSSRSSYDSALSDMFWSML
ncbi:MAG TPA: hypothetical protein VMV94_08085 [Phycisphaerae bacterium]|nr:hypothetical protein [Phycisphaerae bacterium]